MQSVAPGPSVSRIEFGQLSPVYALAYASAAASKGPCPAKFTDVGSLDALHARLAAGAAAARRTPWLPEAGPATLDPSAAHGPCAKGFTVLVRVRPSASSEDKGVVVRLSTCEDAFLMFVVRAALVAARKPHAMGDIDKASVRVELRSSSEASEGGAGEGAAAVPAEVHEWTVAKQGKTPVGQLGLTVEAAARAQEIVVTLGSR